MADEPLDPARVNALSETVTNMFNVVTGGQMEVPEIPPVSAPVEQLPPEVFAPLAAVAMFLTEMNIPGAEQYAFDPYQLSVSNDGLAQMAPTAPPAPAGPPAVSEEELAALV